MQNEYKEFVAGLQKSGEDILKELSPKKAVLQNFALGLAGESGEVVDEIKKHTTYGQRLDRIKLVKELGDVEYYLESIREILGISREEVIRGNIEKLTKRYPNLTYTNSAAIAKADKDAN